MDERLKIILIIIISVSIFGLLVFVFVKNYIKKRIHFYLNEKNKKKIYKRLIIFKYSFFSKSMTFFEVSKSNPDLAKIAISFW